MNFHINITRSGNLLSGKAPQIVQSHLDQAITEATLFLDAKVKANTPQGVYGGLLGSIQHDIPGKGTPLVKGMIMTAHKYAEVIEKGRKPGKGIASADPGGKYVSPLLPWIRVKLGLSGKDAESAAYLIGRKIKLKGFKGAHMFEKALTDNWPQVEKIFDCHGLSIAKELSE